VVQLKRKPEKKMTATMNTDPAVMPTQAKARLSPAGPAAPDVTVVVLDSDASATIGSTFLCYAGLVD
jgi:hypothetical protein